MTVPDTTPAALYQTSLSLFATLMQANYTIFPDGDGVPHLIKLDDEPLTSEEIRNLEKQVKSITFTLYTWREPRGYVLPPDGPGSVSSTNIRRNRAIGYNYYADWNANRTTVMITHGWKSHGHSSACTTIRDAYLSATDSKYNIIVIDWSVIANNIYYPTVANSVPYVAIRVANFVNNVLLKKGLDPKRLKMVGHSLGAHLASVAASIISPSSSVAEVIALDPAFPMFEGKNSAVRVDRSHANHVQIVHTCAGLLGMAGAFGTSDFYANGGYNQPGCGFDLFGICAHMRSYLYYAESVRYPEGFPGSTINGTVKKSHMGGPILDSKAKGYSFKFQTRNESPFRMPLKVKSSI